MGQIYKLSNTRGIYTHANTHSAGNCNLFKIQPFCSCRLSFHNRIQNGSKILLQIGLRKRCAPNCCMHDTSLISPILNLTRFCIFYCFCNIRRYCTNFRIRHQTTRTKNCTQLTYNSHRIRRGNNHIKIQTAFFNFIRQVIKPNDVSTSFLCSLSISALRKYCDTSYLASTLRHNNRSTNHLIRLTRIYTQVKRDINGLIKFGCSSTLNQGNCLGYRIHFRKINRTSQALQTFRYFSHFTHPPHLSPLSAPNQQ